jgi:hypothetical protein
LLLLVLVIVLFLAGAVISGNHRHVTAAGQYPGVALMIAAVVLAAFAAGLIWSGPWLPGGKAVPRETPDSDRGQMAGSTRASARLIQQVPAELDAGAATAKRPKEQAQTAEAAALVHKEQAEAISRKLEAQLPGHKRGTRADTIVIALASSVADGAITYLVTLPVHPLH